MTGPISARKTRVLPRLHRLKASVPSIRFPARKASAPAANNLVCMAFWRRIASVPAWPLLPCPPAEGGCGIRSVPDCSPKKPVEPNTHSWDETTGDQCQDIGTLVSIFGFLRPIDESTHGWFPTRERHIFEYELAQYFNMFQYFHISLLNYGKTMAKPRQTRPIRGKHLPSGAVQKRQTFKQLHVLFVLQQRTMQTRQG